MVSRSSALRVSGRLNVTIVTPSARFSMRSLFVMACSVQAGIRFGESALILLRDNETKRGASSAPRVHYVYSLVRSGVTGYGFGLSLRHGFNLVSAPGRSQPAQQEVVGSVVPGDF